MIKNTLLPIATGCALMATTGCSSIMSHSGASQGYYSGTRANVEMMKSEDAGWVMTPLLVLDLPLTAVMDTVLLPYDYYRSDKDKTADSPRERIKRSEEHTLAGNGNSTLPAVNTAIPVDNNSIAP